MVNDSISVMITIAIAGVGAGVGYLTRIVQKIEDRRDTIHLNRLPIIYSNLLFLKYASTIFTDGGSFQEFAQNVQIVNEKLKAEIYSGEIILFQSKIYQQISKFYLRFQVFQSILLRVKSAGDDSTIKVFRHALEYGVNFENTNPKEVVDSTDTIISSIEEKMKKYRSFSWILMILIIGLGSVVAAIDLVKEELNKGENSSDSNSNQTEITNTTLGNVN